MDTQHAHGATPAPPGPSLLGVRGGRRRLVTGLYFEVVGDPAGQGSVRAIKDKQGNPRVVQGGSAEAKKRLTSWRQRIADAAGKAALGQVFTEAVSVKAEFYLPAPKSLKKNVRWVATQKRDDVDKLARALLDALVEGAVVSDDGIVARLVVTKCYALDRRPGVRVWVTPLDHALAPKG